jgi:hypothetical protein
MSSSAAEMSFACVGGQTELDIRLIRLHVIVRAPMYTIHEAGQWLSPSSTQRTDQATRACGLAGSISRQQN